MKDITSKDYVVPEKLTVDEMDPMQLSRWIALFEAINLIADEAEARGLRFTMPALKKPAIEEYVDSTSPIVYRELTGVVLK
jgi:hypothetical protein